MKTDKKISAPERFIIAAGIEPGDRVFLKSMAAIGQPWVEVQRTQKNQDGSIKLVTHLSDLRLSGSLQQMILPRPRENGESRRFIGQ
jgi:hypothetical protein